MTVEKLPSKPPVGELVLSVQFTPLSKMYSGHFGMFWQEVLPEWKCEQDADSIQDQFEDLDGPMKFMQQISFGPSQHPGRLVLASSSGDRLCQVQRSRYVHNWRQVGTEYPVYSVFLGNFLNGLRKFHNFIEKHGLGPLTTNQWELVYVDVFPEGEDWKELEEWKNVLPGLFASLEVADGLRLCNRNAAWSFELPEGKGRMHVSANLGIISPPKSPDNPMRALMVNTTVRGPIHGWDLDELQHKMDFARKIATGSFKKFVSKSILERCK